MTCYLRIYIVSDISFLILLIEDDMGNVSKWKESLSERTLSRKTPSLMQLVYGESTVNSTSINKEIDNSEDDDSEDDFFKPIEEVKKVGTLLTCTTFTDCFQSKKCSLIYERLQPIYCNFLTV